jgi:hypothetical protein
MASNDSKTVRIINTSHQIISLQVSRIGGDFFKDQQQLHLSPNKDLQIDEKYLVSEQVNNLKERGLLKVIVTNQ